MCDQINSAKKTVSVVEKGSENKNKVDNIIKKLFSFELYIEHDIIQFTVNLLCQDYILYYRPVERMKKRNH